MIYFSTMHNKLYTPLTDAGSNKLQIKRIWDVRADNSYFVNWKGKYPHGGLILLRTISGSGLVELNRIKKLICPPQSLVLIKPQSIRAYRTFSPLWSFVWIELTCHDLFEIPIAKVIICPAIDDEIPSLNSALSSIEKDELSDIAGQHKLKLLIIEWILKIKNEEKKLPAKKNIPEKIAYIMKKTMDKPLTVSELAERARLSQSRFRQVFKTEFAVSPKKYYTHLRMAKAMSCLRNSDIKLSDISDRLSYSSQYHLSRE